MIKYVHKFLSKLIIAICAIVLIVPNAIAAESNLPMADIGDQGVWTTENNRNLFVTQLTNDVQVFQGEFQKQLVKDFVPVEAKIGLALMNGLSFISDVLENSLIRFVIIFIIVAYIFWTMFETYHMMTQTSDVKKLVESLVKKGFVISIWLLVLEMGPARIFMWVMGPIISISTYMSDLILNAVAQSAGANLPDTCSAIREYTMTHASENIIMDAGNAADILCLSTRLSGFFYTAVAAGWQWFIKGIGTSAFTSLVGIAFIVLFIMCAWKFAFMALGVIADLFLSMLMLPFTAIAETVGKTSYKGIAGNIFNGFLAIFKSESLQAQIQRFINAAVYFVGISIVIAFCAAILSSAVDTNLAAQVPTIENQGFIITLLTASLTWWFADKLKDVIKKVTGEDDGINDSFGTTIRGDIEYQYNSIRKQIKSWRDAYKASKKSSK